jgi:DnaJ-domain-containing protein 1
MTDYFALLNEPRRPWLKLDSLKAKFFAASAEAHPDRFHTATEPEKQAAHQRYVELNTAYNVLRDPKERLRHLLELESGAKPKDVQRIPKDLADWFMDVGQLWREVDAFLSERSKVTSPLLKVGMFEQAQAWTSRLTELQSKLTARLTALTTELKQLNARWELAPSVSSPGRAAALPLERLEEMYRTVSYLTRWISQIQERIAQLAF